MTLLPAFLLGFTAGLRTTVAIAAVSWAAFAGRIDLSHSWTAFIGYRFTPWALSLLGLGELVNDKRPDTPSRTVPPQFIGRILTGALAGGLLGVPDGPVMLAVAMGVVGALAGTLLGASARAAASRVIGHDLPAAMLEDAVAIALAAISVFYLI
jgi:uncharacterized membrane protein